MAEKNLVATHDALFLVEHYPTRANKLAIVKKRFVVWYFSTSFPHKFRHFALSVDVFKQIHQKLKSPNVYEM